MTLYRISTSGLVALTPSAKPTVIKFHVGGSPETGNLQASVPAQATLGEVVEVDLSWESLAAGETYLGLLSHGDGTDVLARTLLEVASP